MNKRNLFIGVSALCGSYLQGQTLQTQPNIIYILMDDLGYGDIGCSDNKKVIIFVPA
ncbi:MAG: hypothetical protein K2P55_07190 [Bacteroides acidifaciens]|uniref:hypothetical protein n=1 Tax=Bacteroides acidifaciens TaxID=85831 RepID=UPI0023C88D47|nr:hypothetical protein [Bacteroides acidifaciens]MDE6821410.1 hypothetical protein [Bacteroides acidifaciens]MDE6986707.1 hypothetical protein [Bacteroides acidifaciens]